MNCISAAETGFCTKRCTSDEQTPRPPSPAHHKTFRPLHKYKSFAIPLTLRYRRVWSSNLSTQLRRTQGLNTESLTMPATVADPNRSLDSEQISPATIAHHPVHEKIPNLHQSHMCPWGAQPYLVGPLSRLVGKPPFSPWLPRSILPLKRAANGPNSAISLTQTFDRISLYVYNGLYFGVQKAKNGDRGTIMFTATLTTTRFDRCRRQKVLIGSVTRHRVFHTHSTRFITCAVQHTMATRASWRCQVFTPPYARRENMSEWSRLSSKLAWHLGGHVMM